MIKKILSHSFWLLIGNTIGRLSMFLANIIAARVLSQEEFGQFTMLRNTISMIEGIISGTLGSPMIKRVAEVSDTQDFSLVVKSLFIINIIISLIFAGFIFLLAPIIVELFFMNQQVLVQGLYIGSLILVATTLSGLIQKIFIGIEKYRQLAFAGIYASLVSFPIIIYLIYNFELYGALFGVFTYFTIDMVSKLYTLKKLNVYNTNKLDINIVQKEIKKLLLFSYPLLGSIILSSIAFWYARILVLESSGFEAIGIYDAAFQWLSIIMIITGATTSVVLPMFSKNLDNKKEFSKILKINLLVNFLISICFASIFSIFSKEIMSVYGTNYIQGYQILIILSITSVFYSLSSIFNKLFISKGEIKSIFTIVAISIFIMLLLLKLNILVGIIGLAYSLLVFYGINFILYFIFYGKSVND